MKGFVSKTTNSLRTKSHDELEDNSIDGRYFIILMQDAMSGKNRWLVADEPVEFEK
jgi:hypothetical protein